MRLVVVSVAALFRVVVRLGRLDDLRALLPLLILSAVGCRPEGVGGDLLRRLPLLKSLAAAWLPFFQGGGLLLVTDIHLRFWTNSKRRHKIGLFRGSSAAILPP